MQCYGLQKSPWKITILEDTNLYLQQFWTSLGNLNSHFFQNLMQGFPFVMLHGKWYLVGDLMVVELDEPYEGPS
jgi:hypothetical protein